MKKSAYFKGSFGGKFLNFSEYPIKWLLHRRTPDGYTMEKRVPYGDAKSEWSNLIYKTDRSEKQPVFIYIHGGGWVSGLVDMRNTYCQEFATRGYFAVNVSYTYAPKEVFPYQFKQIFKAIDWIFDNAEKYNLDTDKIVLAGESAGSYFVSYVAQMSIQHDLFEKLGVEFRNKDRFRVSAVISNCGAVNIETLVDSKFMGIKYMLNAFTGLSPKEIRAKRGSDELKIFSPQITEGFPPTVLIYASHDFLKTESFDLAKRFDEVGTPYLLYKADGIISMHAFPIATIEKRGKECLRQTYEYVTQYVNK